MIDEVLHHYGQDKSLVQYDTALRTGDFNMGVFKSGFDEEDSVRSKTYSPVDYEDVYWVEKREGNYSGKFEEAWNGYWSAGRDDTTLSSF